MIGWMFIALVVAAALVETFAQPKRYDGKETLANLGTYLGYLAIGVLWTPVLFEIYSSVHDRALFDLGPYWLDPTAPAFYASWLVLFVLEDLTFYAFHRTSHRIGILWASHATHHSSTSFNLSVALRQTWTPFVAFPFWLPLLFIGFDPLMVLGAQFLSLSYQAGLHTELIPDLGPLEWIYNTPRHHRLHHGANEPYRDKNFGGVLIIWDRLFGTFARESEPIRFGIDRSVARNPVLIGLHGWIDLAKSTFLEGDLT